MKLILSLAVGVLLSINAWAGDYSSQCQPFPSPLPGAYCVHVPTHDPSGDVLYHFHGRGSSEQSWLDSWYYPEQIRSEWHNHKVHLPIVVSVSFGPIWIMAEKNSSPQSGLFELFTQKIMPAIEAQLGGLKGRRLLVGESMGGFNSIQMALKTELFAKVAVLCAPMSAMSPFAPMSEIEDHVKKSSAWQYYMDAEPNPVLQSVKDSIQLAQIFYPSPAEWPSGNPLNLAAAHKVTAQSADLYVAIGFYDKYASYEANEKFVAMLTASGHKVEWRPQWGGHCAFDVPSLAKFLVE